MHQGAFPAALLDCVAAVYHVHTKHQVPLNKIFLLGDSAGGNLVLATARYFHEHPLSDGPELALAGLLLMSVRACIYL